MRSLTIMDREVLSIADRYVMWGLANNHVLSWREFYEAEKVKLAQYARKGKGKKK